MSVWVLIPTGDRPETAIDAIKAWSLLKEHDIKIAVYTWDQATFDKAKEYADWIEFGERKSFAKLQNYMAGSIGDDWVGIVCAADDLFPFANCQHLQFCCDKHNGKLLFIFDMINNEQPCHPVITKKWYDDNLPSKIFDEGFSHCFCDTDLFIRHIGSFVKIKDIAFDHRHWAGGKRKKDIGDKLAASTWTEDHAYFNMKHNLACA